MTSVDLGPGLRYWTVRGARHGLLAALGVLAWAAYDLRRGILRDSCSIFNHAGPEDDL